MMFSFLILGRVVYTFLNSSEVLQTSGTISTLRRPYAILTLTVEYPRHRWHTTCVGVG
jgi:hypothetical protein